MKPETLKRWREHHRLSLLNASLALGCSKTSLVKWEKGGAGAPKYIGLACAAYSQGLRPWGETADP